MKIKVTQTGSDPALDELCGESEVPQANFYQFLLDLSAKTNTRAQKRTFGGELIVKLLPDYAATVEIYNDYRE
jgi:hypothetical protein